jgi:alanyl-tRNA synthetase
VRPFGGKDNFWEMAEVGPCGPCSEIHYDRGEPLGCGKESCGPNCPCGRFIELWNLVFIQYNREPGGGLSPLAARHIDTGMGLERLAAILQGVASNYDTDLFTPLIRRIGEVTGRPYEGEACVPIRVISDHIRALAIAVSDGVNPSNEGRGYVLRRLLRRAARYGRKLLEGEPFLHKVVPAAVEVLGPAFPNLAERASLVEETVRREEERFNRVIDRGIRLFQETAEKAEAAGGMQIPGKEAFVLYDTYGFPVDLVEVMARERGLSVDEEGFRKEKERQQGRSRRGARFDTEIEEDLTRFPETRVAGYEALEAEAHLLGVTETGGLVLDSTPFYGESGGQVGDRGVITAPEFEFEVQEVQRRQERFVHLGEMTSGVLPKPGAAVQARVDPGHRLSVMRNHTATHLLHNGLRKFLGLHVEQRGSLVAPDRLRFDFSHFQQVPPEELRKIEDYVNRRIWEDHPVRTSIRPLQEALDSGIIAIFGEKYGEKVRVVEVGDVSRELCGGTHVSRSGEIGMLRILSESSVAADTRRIEAVTGGGVLELLNAQEESLRGISQALGAPLPELLRRCENLQQEIKALRKENEHLKSEGVKDSARDMEAKLRRSGGIALLAGEIPGASDEDLRRALDGLRKKHIPGAFLLVSNRGGSLTLMCAVTDDLAAKGLRAGDLMRKIAPLVDGRGGGKPHMAQGGGKNPGGLSEAYALFEKEVAALGGAGASQNM